MNLNLKHCINLMTCILLFHHGPYFIHTQQGCKCEILEQQKLRLRIAGTTKPSLFTRRVKYFVRQAYFRFFRQKFCSLENFQRTPEKQKNKKRSSNEIFTLRLN